MAIGALCPYATAQTREWAWMNGSNYAGCFACSKATPDCKIDVKRTTGRSAGATAPEAVDCLRRDCGPEVKRLGLLLQSHEHFDNAAAAFDAGILWQCPVNLRGLRGMCRTYRHHSYRSATMGSTFIARRAGI